MLDYKSSVYEEYWVSYSRYDLNKLLTGVKKELPWLNECSIYTLQYPIKDSLSDYLNILSSRRNQIMNL